MTPVRPEELIRLLRIKKWRVPDVPADMGKVKFVFILESPHKKELAVKCPAAGSAGKAMSKFLLGINDKAFGEAIRDGDTKDKYAIVNVCQIPMQTGAYDKSLPLSQKKIVQQLERLRNPGLKSENSELYLVILSDFLLRLKRINKNARIIPCGKFARKALPSDLVGINQEIPHPSFGNWHKKRYKKALTFLKTLVTASD